MRISNRVFSEDEAWNSYGQWIVSNNGYIHESLTFHTIPSSGRSIITTAPIPRGTQLVSCSHTLFLSYARARSLLPSTFTSTVNKHTSLCFALCQQWILGEASFWYPYLRILPREFNTPLYFSDADLKFLVGCNLSPSAVEERRAIWKGEWKEGLEALKSAGEESVAEYTWELYLWAATIFSSRSFPGNFVDKAHDSPVLFPILDALNHQPCKRITWQIGTEEVAFLSVDAIAAGVEVYNNYGPKGNEELLMGYGFCIPENPAETVALRFNTPPLAPEQAEIYKSLKHPDKEDYYYLTLKAGYPLELISLFRLLTAAPSEMRLLENTPYKSVSVRNELATQFQLVMAISKKLQGFETVALEEPVNQRQQAALTLRSGQQEILRSALSHSRETISSLFTEHEGKEIFSIETVLQNSVFAEAVEACFETSDVEEIIEAEQEDIVFVLWLCWKYITKDEKWSGWFDRMKGVYPMQEEMTVEEVFEAIFPEAAEAAPEVFGGEEWTAALMGWVMAVYQQEGVNVEPEEGKLVWVISNECPQ
ncbi:hypothetical protein FN846DRAFT_450492 [Sphaerosporella brunnea]|uniref:SET domain-containing protein n=1 Tax=Sphaerosporella brunnea TaxID=1250544 RepID=A0A5J5F4W8_9PEZI|nr:hypothetical protein FN846DRAFT_450492 [Sphaerosporella brunnea]